MCLLVLLTDGVLSPRIVAEVKMMSRLQGRLVRISYCWLMGEGAEEVVGGGGL